MSKHITIQYPDKIADALQLSSKEFEKEAKIAMAVKLFEMKKISSGIGAQIAEMDRVHFLLILSQYGVNMIDYDADELDTDLSNA